MLVTPYMQGVSPLRVGILGGMGSYATLHFFQKLVDSFQVEKEWQRPRVIVDNNCILPSRTRALLYDEGRAELVAGMAASLRQLLGYDPHAVVIPCNTAHVFLPEVQAVLGPRPAPVVHLVESTAAHLGQLGVSEAALLATEGTILSRVYDAPCAAHGVTLRYPDASQQKHTNELIEQVKQKQPLSREGFHRFLGELGVSTVVLGCTELSVQGEAAGPVADVAVVDPLAVVIERIHRVAGELEAAG